MNHIYKKVYILAPYNHHTGGVELAHQLIHKLNEFGQPAYVVYVNGPEISEDQTITPEYIQYNILSSNIVEDSSDNLIVLPEIYFEYIHRFSKINIACWWMSVDNRYNNANIFDMLRFRGSFRGKLSALKHFKPSNIRISDKSIIKLGDRIIHFYQSTYAMHHLYNRGFSKILPLGDYINSQLLQQQSNDNKKREDIVLYNPAKGYRFTQKIIKHNPEVQFIPLRGYNRTELSDIMRKSKVYIDFGNFPGKDRLSREAVINGNIIITGTLGASAYFEDVPIQNKYKFSTNKRSIEFISFMIKNALKNYETMYSDFNYYRKRIYLEESHFENQIKEYFFS